MPDTAVAVLDEEPQTLGDVLAFLRAGFHGWIFLALRLAVWRLLRRQTPAPLLLRTRVGPVLSAPPRDGAWWTVYQVFAMDVYRLSDIEGHTNPMMFLDIGANVGAFATAVCARWPAAQGVCVEPAPAIFTFLQRNLAANGLAGRVRTIEAAVASPARSRTVSLLERHSDSPRNTIISDDSPEASRCGRWTAVRAVTLEEIIGDVAGPIDLLKLDVEGAEYESICQTPLEALKRVRRAVVEYHPVPGHGYNEIVERFQEAGLLWSRWERGALSGMGTCWFHKPA